MDEHARLSLKEGQRDVLFRRERSRHIRHRSLLPNTPDGASSPALRATDRNVLNQLEGGRTGAAVKSLHVNPYQAAGDSWLWLGNIPGEMGRIAVVFSSPPVPCFKSGRDQGAL